MKVLSPELASGADRLADFAQSYYSSLPRPPARPPIDLSRLRELRLAEYAEPTRVLRAQVAASSRRAEHDELVVWEQAYPAQELYLPPMQKHALIVPLDSELPAADWIGWGEHVMAGELEHIVAVPAGRALYLRNQRAGRNLHVNLSASLLSAHAGEREGGWVRGGLVPLDPVAQALVAALREGLRSGGLAPDVMNNTALALADQVLGRQSPQPQPSRGAGLSRQQVRAITRYIGEHLGDPLSLADLAGVAGLSPAHFCRSFQAAAGTSPMKFVTRLRMERARKLVEGTALPMTEVAFETGFTDAAHFSRAFSKCWGVAPSKLRRAGA